jgi:arginyl-tRNA synthetase
VTARARPGEARPRAEAALLARLREAVWAAAEELAGTPDGATGEAASARRGAITLERPPRAELGDYSTNAALLLAPALGCTPREVAERVGAELQRRLGASLERFEVAGPGFVNLFLADAWLRGALGGALAAGEAFGAAGSQAGSRSASAVADTSVAENAAGELPTRERILVEFVSANPTGPMHVGHARNAAYGDALARLLAFRGHEVQREFYVNDTGSQVRKLGESIHALARGEPVPEDGYRGAYVQELLARLSPADGADPGELGRAAVRLMVEDMRGSLETFGVRFDAWTYESALHAGDPSPVAHALAILEREGHTYRSEGALWLRTSDHGDDKDRVLVRANGEPTYFASDIAYHEDKRERGFDRQIDVWGADHHGYVARMRAAYEALGGDSDHLELLIMQLVHLVRRGERAQMSKRSGEFVTLEALLAEIGVDAARWYLLARSHDTTVELDLDLAREQSSENPVYYVQYAHARIASMLAKAGGERVRAALAAVAAGEGEAAWEGSSVGAEGSPAAANDSPPAWHASERALVKRLLAFPEEVAEAAARRAPHKITAYALALAQDFTAFYRDCRVVGAEPAAVESLRIALSVAVQRTLARCLHLLGMSAPEEM